MAAGPRPTWTSVWQQPGLLAWMAVDQWFALGTACVGAFQALRLARDLGLTDAQVGVVLSVAAFSGFAGTLAVSAGLQERLGARKTLILVT